MLSRALKANGRPVAFTFKGAAPAADGSEVLLKTSLLEEGVAQTVGGRGARGWLLGGDGPGRPMLAGQARARGAPRASGSCELVLVERMSDGAPIALGWPDDRRPRQPAKAHFSVEEAAE